MAQMYKVSADVSEKEKAIGGILTFGQGGWLALGFILIAGLFLILTQFLPGILALILAVPPGAIVGCMFAFYKKEELPLSTYLLYRRNFKKKTKLLVNDMTFDKKFEKEDELFV